MRQNSYESNYLVTSPNNQIGDFQQQQARLYLL